MGPELLVAILAIVVSLLVSSFSIYHSYYKGPSISFQLEYKPDLEKMKGDISTMQTDLTLIFSNSGNSSGVVREVGYNFFPEKTFKDFFFYRPGSIMETFTLEGSDTKHDKRLISLHLKYLHSSYRDTPPPVEASSILQFISGVEEYRRQRLSDFIRLLNENEKLGRLEITMESTKKTFRRLLKLGFSKTSKSVELKSEDFKDAFNDIEIGQAFKIDAAEEINKTLKAIEMINRELGYDRDYIKHAIENKHPPHIDSHSVIRSLLDKTGYPDFFILEHFEGYREIIESEIHPIITNVKRLQEKISKKIGLPESMREASEKEMAEHLEEIRKDIASAQSKFSEIEEKVTEELKEAMATEE